MAISISELKKRTGQAGTPDPDSPGDVLANQVSTLHKQVLESGCLYDGHWFASHDRGKATMLQMHGRLQAGTPFAFPLVWSTVDRQLYSFRHAMHFGAMISAQIDHKELAFLNASRLRTEIGSGATPDIEIGWPPSPVIHDDKWLSLGRHPGSQNLVTGDYTSVDDTAELIDQLSFLAHTTVVVHPRTSKIVACGKGIKPLLDWEPSELLGQHIETILPDYEPDCHGESARQKLTEDIEAKNKAGEEVMLQIHANDSHGIPIVFLAPADSGGAHFGYSPAAQFYFRQLREEQTNHFVDLNSIHEL